MRLPFGAGARLSPEQEQSQRQAWADLEAGRLPPSSRERLASQIDAKVFTSALSTRDLVAVRAAGFEPVGQVFGTATFVLSRQQSYWQSNPAWTGYGPPTDPYRLKDFHGGELRARARALTRMIAECVELGGAGVIGASVLRSFGNDQMYEFSIVGTAVRRAGAAPVAEKPFVTQLEGAHWGQLVRGGWRPVDRLLTAKVRWVCPGPIYWANSGGGLRTAFGATSELTSLSRLNQLARADARAELQVQTQRAHATGMILHSFDARFEHEEGYYWVEVDTFATAISPEPFTDPIDVRMVMHLDTQGSRDEF